MAMLFQNRTDGIQLGIHTDRCLFCEREANNQGKAIEDGLLTKQNVFVLTISGLRRVICMKHFNELLGDKYVLLTKEEVESMQELATMLSEDEVLELDRDKLEECKTVEEADAYIKEELEKKEEKKDVKTTKAAKSSKGK